MKDVRISPIETEYLKISKGVTPKKLKLRITKMYFDSMEDLTNLEKMTFQRSETAFRLTKMTFQLIKVTF